jgi:hypothetical protein
MIQRNFVFLVFVAALVPSLACADALFNSVARPARPFIFSATLVASYVPLKIASHLIDDGFCKNSRVQFCCIGGSCKRVPPNTTKCDYPNAGHLYCSNDTNIQPFIIPLISSNVEAEVHLNYAGPFIFVGAGLFWVGTTYTLNSLIVDMIPFVLFKGIIGSPYAISLFALHIASGLAKS